MFLVFADRTFWFPFFQLSFWFNDRFLETLLCSGSYGAEDRWWFICRFCWCWTELWSVFCLDELLCIMSSPDPEGWYTTWFNCSAGWCVSKELDCLRGYRQASFIHDTPFDVATKLSVKTDFVCVFRLRLDDERWWDAPDLDSNLQIAWVRILSITLQIPLWYICIYIWPGIHDDNNFKTAVLQTISLPTWQSRPGTCNYRKPIGEQNQAKFEKLEG